MTSPTAGSSPSPATSPQPVPSAELEKTAAALADGGGTVESPNLELRQAIITAVNLAAATCSVAIGGDSTSVPNVHYLSNYKPTVNDTCWVLVNGPDILALDRDGKFGAAAFAGLGQATVATNESRSNTAYGDLATVGPSVAATVPASGRLLVCVSADVQSPTSVSSAFSVMSFAISGATTLAASDTNGLASVTFNASTYSTSFNGSGGTSHSHSFSGSGSNSGGTVSIFGTTDTAFISDPGHSHTITQPTSLTEIIASRVVLLTGLTPGAVTVASKYRTSGGSGTWGGRSLWVLPI